MFNALNRFMSRLDGDVPDPLRPSSSSPSRAEQGAYGFQVLRNTTMSLAVEPFFDFIIGINGRLIDNPDTRLFAQEVRNCAGGMLSLGLWSAKGQRRREIHVALPSSPASLGLTLQWTPLAVAANIWHVLDVASNSPADTAGLLPYGDYILGSPEGVLHGEGALGELVEDHIGRPMRLFVYNNEFDVAREVTVQPNRDWGGEGALGCTLGYGALHRLPAPLSEPVSAPGETMFDGEGGAGGSSAVGAVEGGGVGAGEGAFVPATMPSAHMLVPADLTTAPTAPPLGGPGMTSAPPRTGKKKERHHKPPNSFMDDYLREEEQKSRELDRAPSGRATPAPPPPKVGESVPPPPPPPPPPPATAAAAETSPSGPSPVKVEDAPEEQGQ